VPIDAAAPGSGSVRDFRRKKLFEIPGLIGINRSKMAIALSDLVSGIVRGRESGGGENRYDSSTFRESSLYFQSSALPTELPGLGMRI
jgi:hypothetical protein